MTKFYLVPRFATGVIERSPRHSAQETPLIGDLRSDMLTCPNEPMLAAMTKALDGNDCYGKNTTVRELETYCTAQYGKDAALFMPSGTMLNACVATGTSPRAYAAEVDALCVDLAKGLGAP
jgi:threonine aldolase